MLYIWPEVSHRDPACSNAYGTAAAATFSTKIKELDRASRSAFNPWTPYEKWSPSCAIYAPRYEDALLLTSITWRIHGRTNQVEIWHVSSGSQDANE